jgi:hypothetical protein
MQNVIFWLVIIGTGIWTFQWVVNIQKSLGHTTMIIPILLLRIMIIYFYKNPEISKYHMIWISPFIIVIEMILNMIIFRIIRKI